MKYRGFTLIEMMFTLTLFSLILLIGLPSFTHVAHQQQYQRDVRQLQQDLQFTRALAVQRNQRAVIKPKQEWAYGWEIFIDSNNNGERDAGESLIRDQAPLRALEIKSDSKLRYYISFIGTGEARFASIQSQGAMMMGSLLLCSAQTGAVKKLLLSRGGRARIDNQPLETCNS